MSKIPSKASSHRIRSFRYRIKSERGDSNNTSLTINRFDNERQTPSFFMNTKQTVKRVDLFGYKSNSCRKATTIDFEKQLKQEYSTLQPNTARTFQTFMNRQGNKAWRGKSRIKLPLIQSNPEISFTPVILQHDFMMQQLQKCTNIFKNTIQQIKTLKFELLKLSQTKSQLDSFSLSFLNKCQILKKSLVKNNLRHFEFVMHTKQKIEQVKIERKQIKQQIEDTIKKARKIQRSIFNQSFEIELEKQYLVEL